MEYNLIQDMESVLELTGYSMEQFAGDLGVSRITVSNWINGKTAVSPRHVDDFYRYAFGKGIYLNKIKEQFYREDMISGEEVLLFHGARSEIVGGLGLDHNKRINDFGNGFYCGESLEQSAMFVAGHKKSSIYMLKFDPRGLTCRRFHTDRDWMLTIALFRRRLEQYADSNVVSHLRKSVEEADYIIAPIADNRMFEIIDSFIDGEITDVQCQHCLSATNLGLQYVFVSEKALSRITMLERCYLADPEKDAYLRSRQESFKMNMDKVKLARRQYRNQGQYIEDILK